MIERLFKKNCVYNRIEVSIVRRSIWSPKNPNNHPKFKEKFIIAVGKLLAVRLKTIFVVFEVLHFRNNNPQLQPTDTTVTLLICFREETSSIDSKDDVIPA